MRDGDEGEHGKFSQVVRASDADARAIADALADAFFDDPVMSWILPKSDSRIRRLSDLFGILLRVHYLRLGDVWTTSDKVGGAMWAPPGRAIIPPATMIRNMHLVLRALGRQSVRALRALSHVEKSHPTEPHWYLAVLGTRTARQGTGIGTALLGPVLERCDRDGTHAYLESSKPSNIPFYRRFGFEVAGEIQLPGGGPSVWPMWREPQGQ